MGRKSLKEVRQKEIINAFYIVAKKEGLENASLAKVAKEMGVNTSLVLHYFTSKDELIFGLISYILENYKEIYTSENKKNSKNSKLRNIINNLFSRNWNELIDDGVFYSCFTLIFRDAKIKAAFKDLHEYLRLLLTNAIQEAKENGEVFVENPKETANLIFILVEGSYYYLSLFEIDNEYNKRLNTYKKAAYSLLKLEEHNTTSL